MNFHPPRYRNQSNDFFKTLKLRTDEYFNKNRTTRQANTSMRVKTIIMLAAYFTPYCLMLLLPTENWMIHIGLWMIMGVAMAGIGLSIMHDAIHGSYSKNKTVNTILGEVINLVGGASINWKIQHNVLHHTYTNIDGYDEDIDTPFFLRFSPNVKLRKVHKLQFLYAWFFYGLLTLNWATFKDFDSLLRYKKMGLLKSTNTTFKKELIKLLFFRTAYFSYIIVLPLLFSNGSALVTILGFLAMHWVAGFILSCIFQPAHVMETSEFSNAKNGEEVGKDWASHQVLNTVNFAPKNKLLTWYVGGLNFQIEHHLFPNICHVHYTGLSKIVEETAKEFNLPYNVKPTFRSALWSHMKMLKQLGRA